MSAVTVPPAGTKVFTVSQLTNEVKGVLENGFTGVWVSGEITGYKKHTSGHCYLKLKDAGAVLNAVIYRGVALRLRFDPRDGTEVIARGRLSVYAPQGQYQFAIEEIHPKGVGAQELALKQLRQKLFHKGYFAPARKRKLPYFPERICLVTSPTGAAVRDMLEILGRRWPSTPVWVCPVRVQGETAAGEIADALALVNRVGGVSVIILGRGGGSSEDLAPFNDERVADAIFASRIPVVSAVGHEIDVTIADSVADVRALTPSEAAERVVPNRDDILKNLDETHSRLRELLWGRLDLLRQRLFDLAGRRCFRRPLQRVQDAAQRLDVFEERLQRAVLQQLEQRQLRLQAACGHLESLSPLNVLGRGYSLTRRESDRQVVRSAQHLQPGDRVVTVLQHGQFTSRVEKIALPAEK
jgi:exodeoxyribonuclease VII large subunit